MKKLLIKNSVYGVIQTLLSALILFASIPVFINELGSEAYGLFALVMVIGNLNGFVNLGLTSALVKFLAEQGKTEESNVDIAVNLILTTILMLPLSLLSIYLNKFVLIEILGISESLYGQAKWLYIFSIIANLLLFIGQGFKAVVDALQKIYISSMLQLLYNMLYWGLILIFILLGWNLFGVGLSILLSASVWFILSFIYMKKEWGRILSSKLKSNFIISAKKLFNYGVRVYASGAIGFFYEPFSKILISHFIGVTEVGFYDMALRLRNQLWGLVTKLFTPLYPFISEQKEKHIIRKYVHEIEQKAFFVLIPIVSLIIINMYPFINLWIGENVEVISIASIFIISFHLLGSSTIMPVYLFLMVKDLVNKTIIIQLSIVFFNTIFFLITVNFIGFYALIIGNVAAILSSFFLALYYQKKYLDSLIFDSASQVIKLVFVFIVNLILGFALNSLLLDNDYLKISFSILIISTVSIYLYRMLRIVQKKDIEMFFGFNEKLSRVVSAILIK